MSKNKEHQPNNSFYGTPTLALRWGEGGIGTLMDVILYYYAYNTREIY